MKLKNRKNHSYLYYSRLNEKSRLKFQPYLTLSYSSNRERKRENTERKHGKREENWNARSVVIHLRSPISPVLTSKKKKTRRGWIERLAEKGTGEKRPSTPGSKTEYPDTGVSFNDFASLFDWHGERRGWFRAGGYPGEIR